MNRNTKIYTLITLFLGVCALWTLWSRSQKSNLQSEETSFAVSDSTNLVSIALFKSDQKLWQLTKAEQGSIWSLNQTTKQTTTLPPTQTQDQKTEVDAVIIQKFCQALFQIQAIKPVSPALVMEIEKAKNPLFKIVLSSTEDILQEYEYYIYENQCIAKLKKAKQWFQIGLRKDDFTRYLQVDPLFYKNRQIFASSEQSLRSLSIGYKNEPEQNFTLIYQNKRFGISGMPDIDSIKVKSYLYYMQDVRIKKWIDRPSLKDSLLALKPTFIFSVDDLQKDKSGKIQIYYEQNNQEHVYALLDREPYVIEIQKMIFNYLLQPKSFFKTSNSNKTLDK